MTDGPIARTDYRLIGVCEWPRRRSQGRECSTTTQQSCCGEGGSINADGTDGRRSAGSARSTLCAKSMWRIGADARVPDQQITHQPTHKNQEATVAHNALNECTWRQRVFLRALSCVVVVCVVVCYVIAYTPRRRNVVCAALRCVVRLSIRLQRRNDGTHVLLERSTRCTRCAGATDSRRNYIVRRCSNFSGAVV